MRHAVGLLLTFKLKTKKNPNLNYNDSQIQEKHYTNTMYISFECIAENMKKIHSKIQP